VLLLVEQVEELGDGMECYTCGDGGSLSCQQTRCSSVACENAASVLDDRKAVACRNAPRASIPVNVEVYLEGA